MGGVARYDGELVHLAAFHGPSAEGVASMRAGFPMTAGRRLGPGARRRGGRAGADLRRPGGSRLRAEGRHGAARLPQHRGRADDPRRPGHRLDRRLPRGAERLPRQARPAAAHLRRPGGDRDRERAALQRDQGGARAADRDRGDPEVIASSPSDVQPVFDAIVRNAVTLCDSMFANVFRFDGELLHWAASHNLDPDTVELLRRNPRRPEPSLLAGRVILTAAVARLPDALADPAVRPAVRGHRRLAIDARRADAARRASVGAIVVGWHDPGPISARHDEMLKTFADQAVIAIENVRLFNETRLEGRAAPRAERGARLPDRDQRGAARHQPVADRRGAGVRGDRRVRDAPVRQRRRRCLPLRRRARRLVATRNWPRRRSRCAHRSIRRRRAGPAGRPRHPRGERSASTTRCSTPRTTMRRAERRAGAHGRCADAEDGVPVGAILVAWPEPGRNTAAPGRPVQDLRRPGGDRDRERAPVQRDQGGARAADRDGRDPARHQQLADRRAAGVRCDRRAGDGLCGGSMVAATRFDGELLHLVSYRGTSARGEAAMRAAFPMPLEPRLGQRPRHPRPGAGADRRRALATPNTSSRRAPIVSGWTSCLSVPLLHEGRAIGAIAVARPSPGASPSSRSRCSRPSPTRP